MRCVDLLGELSVAPSSTARHITVFLGRMRLSAHPPGSLRKVAPTPGPLGALTDEATSESHLLTGRDSRTQEFLRVVRISREFISGFRALHFAPPCITFFGSARFDESTTHYTAARELAAEVAKLGFAVMTGGGPGLMEASNRGAKDVGGTSYGATIDIGREPGNPYVDKRIPFHYFFARKVVLVKYSYGFVHLPGGFGTLDEMFEALTLMQTDRLGEFPVILYGTEYWGGMVDWITDTLLSHGAIIQADVDRFLLTDDPAEVVAALAPVAHRLSLKSPDVSRLTPTNRVERARRFGRL